MEQTRIDAFFDMVQPISWDGTSPTEQFKQVFWKFYSKKASVKVRYNSFMKYR